jgi:NAD(P)-dependent dehydrogenase (short-subunit alcohol dehydrogenase family)
MSLAAECLSGRNAVVVGASSGINLGIAHRLGSLGARIAIISRSQERSKPRLIRCAPMLLMSPLMPATCAMQPPCKRS